MLVFICTLHRWSIIAAHLHKRTDNEIKNYWNSHVKKRLIRMGIDPITHKPKANNIIGHYSSKDAAIMSHMAQWESARLQAETRESMLQLGSCSSSHETKLIIGKIPPQPSPSPRLDVLKAWQSSGSLESPSTKHNNNNNTMYNMYAIMLSTDHGLPSPVSTLHFSECKLPTSTTAGQCSKSSLSFEDDGNTSSGDKIIREGIVCSSQDDDIMVVVEAFRRDENVPEFSNGAMEGLNDMPDFERFAEEYGYGNFNLEANFHYWNSSLANLDCYSKNSQVLLD